MISRTRKTRFFAVILLGVGGLVAVPNESFAARTELDCTFCVDNCDVDLNRVCENHGCTPNAPSCYASECYPLFSAAVTCNPV